MARKRWLISVSFLLFMEKTPELTHLVDTKALCIRLKNTTDGLSVGLFKSRKNN